MMICRLSSGTKKKRCYPNLVQLENNDRQMYVNLYFCDLIKHLIILILCHVHGYRYGFRQLQGASHIENEGYVCSKIFGLDAEDGERVNKLWGQRVAKGLGSCAGAVHGAFSAGI